MGIEISKITGRVIVITFAIALMYFGKNILIPLAFSMFFALMLYPVCKFFERRLSRVLSIMATFIIVVALIIGIMYFFGTQFYHLFENIQDFGQNILTLINKLLRLLDEKVLHGRIDINKIVENESFKLIGSGKLIENTISTSTSIVTSVILIFVYTFLFLLYRSSFKKLYLYHFPVEKKEHASGMLYTIQKVSQKYLFGILLVMFILGSLNGMGLWVIGLDYPFLFGYFAALLAIVPYIGTFIGGLLPFLYALINSDRLWTALFVLLWYIFVQALEGNFLTPKIVGSNVSLNPLIALIALITGGIIWGIAGMVLFIPFMAILKVIFDNTGSLKPYGLLFSSDFGNTELPLLKRGKKKDKQLQETND